MVSMKIENNGLKPGSHWSPNERRLLTGLTEHGMVETLLDLLDDGVVVHDEQRKIYLANKVITDLTGQTRKDIVGKDCHEAFPPSGLCGSGCAFRSDEDPDNSRREHEVTFVRPDGGVRKIAVRSTPIVIKERVMGVLALIRDLTELTDLRWQLNKRSEFHGLIGVSDAIAEVFETIRSVGPSDYPVLITGESGTGKELVAGAIHRESRRKAGPFVPVNCGALPENILESELFGHVRGAFTGAIRDKKGRFELAHGGTIFLDEVGELPLHMQAKLLRVLQEKTFERVGGEKSVRVDVRVVAATNRDLRQMIQDGLFRDDLFYRLCVVPIELPPLRDRQEDIPHIARSIVEKVGKETGKDIDGIDDRALEVMMVHPWPGNVRELMNALQFASVHCRGSKITAEDLPFELRSGGQSRGSRPPTSLSRVSSSAPPPPVTHGLQVVQTHRRGKKRLTPQTVMEALDATGGNKLKAAKLLGVGRATLYRFFEDHPDIFME